MVKKERLGGLRMLNFDLLCRSVSSPTVAVYQVCLCRVLLIILASQANMLKCILCSSPKYEQSHNHL